MTARAGASAPTGRRRVAIGRRPGPDADARARPGGAVAATSHPAPDAPVNAAARVSRTSRAWLSRFSTLIRLSDPSRQAVADDQVRPLVVDVDLERPAVAGHEHRLADRLEVVADGVDVERRVDRPPGAGTSSRSRTPRRRARRASMASGRRRRGRRDRPRPASGRRGGAAPPGTAGTGPGRPSRRRRPRAGSPAGSASARPTSRRASRVAAEDGLDVVVALGGGRPRPPPTRG